MNTNEPARRHPVETVYAILDSTAFSIAHVAGQIFLAYWAFRGLAA